uniref:Secreted protein n=1 Tax=Haemonchus contortus TaxID=6289 RepID=A0A7I4Y9N3_HAECO
MKTPKVFILLTISTLSLLCYFLYSTDQFSQAWQLVSLSGLHQKNQSDGTDIQNIQLSFKATTSSIFDTCPLVLYNHLDPQLLQFHLPDSNHMAKCRPYKPFTTLH